jgi:hypothetical protein
VVVGSGVLSTRVDASWKKVLVARFDCSPVSASTNINYIPDYYIRYSIVTERYCSI